MKIEVIYHPKLKLLYDPLAGANLKGDYGTIGIKLTDEDRQYGVWDFLPVGHTWGTVFEKLAKLSLIMQSSWYDKELTDAPNIHVAPATIDKPVVSGEGQATQE